MVKRTGQQIPGISPLVTAGRVNDVPRMRTRAEIEERWMALHSLLVEDAPRGTPPKFERFLRKNLKRNVQRFTEELLTLEWVLGALDDSPFSAWQKVIRKEFDEKEK